MNSAKSQQSSREQMETSVQRVEGVRAPSVKEVLVTEEPLEIQLAFGNGPSRQVKPISITMRRWPNNAADCGPLCLGSG